MKKKDDQTRLCGLNRDLLFSECFLRSVVESSPSGILIVNQDKKAVIHNRLFAKMWRIPGDVMRTGDDERMLSFVLSQLKDSEAFLRKTKHLYAQKDKRSLDLLEFADGRFFERYSAPVRGRDGVYYGRIWYFRDVTKMKKAEMGLLMSEKKCRTVFDCAADIVFITPLVKGNSLGNFLQINKAGPRKLGYSNKEFLNMNPWQVVTKESMADARLDIVKLKKYGRATFERVMVTKKGRTFPVEMNVRLINLFGRPMLMAIARDISDRKRMEEYLREEKDKLQRYLDVSGVITIIFDSSLKVSLINKKGCEVFGCKSEDVLGRNWVELFISKHSRSDIRKKIEGFFSEKSLETMVIESVIVAAGGEERNIVWRFAMLTDGPGREMVALGVGTDITDFKRAKVTIAELKEINNLKDEFLNIATHELKTPLTSIIGLSEVMLGKSLELPLNFVEYLKIIHVEGLRLAKTMKQMLDVARYESGRVAVVREKFDSTEFIRSLRPALSVLARDKKFRLIIGEEAGSLAVKSDKQRVSQVIYDLIDNAVKHSEAKNIALSLSKVGDDEALVEVIDDGCGIPQELQSKLFLKFYQLNPSLSRPQDGIGLGLYSCKLAVDSLGGRIGVKSSSGKGSKFFFTLPLEK